MLRLCFEGQEAESLRPAPYLGFTFIQYLPFAKAVSGEGQQSAKSRQCEPAKAGIDDAVDQLLEVVSHQRTFANQLRICSPRP